MNSAIDGVAPVEAQSSDVNAIVTIATAALDRILDGFIKDVNVRFTLRDEFIEALEIEAEEHGRTAGVKAPAATPPNCCPQCMGEGWVELKRLCKKHGSGVALDRKASDETRNSADQESGNA
jgi:hypothetical protein